MSYKSPELIIIGGGLAGCEAAWQAAKHGVHVILYEMRPFGRSGAHTTDKLAELICSNSLGSNLPDRASGLLKEELRMLGSFLLECAEITALPAGGALAVDREAFANLVTERICHNPLIKLIRQEYVQVPDDPAIICSGPLTSASLTESIQKITGQKNLFFFDAIAPIIASESINMEIAFRASRFNRGERVEGDYINCPFSQEQYELFVNALCSAQQITLKEFEQEIQNGVTAGASHFFEGCLPVEIIARRGKNSLAFGPMRPIGLVDVHNGKRPFAVVQLRQDNMNGTLYNMVGFQTNLTYPEQQRVFRMIPGLEDAEFIRFGQMHRNTFIASPLLLKPTLQFHDRPDLFFAGQITGVEGYMGNIATGLLAGINAAKQVKGEPLLEIPDVSMIGALCRYITQSPIDDFQPMKANFGILPPLSEQVKGKREKAQHFSTRSLAKLEEFIQQIIPAF